ncbi:ATP-binding protein [Burkholderia gladioli]|uniref:ATP-binding protein n=1 Tax=Burkholderia gladioli TaxID=28095 RepID=UPI000CDA4DBB|nr:winged helix-turn-helix domain-containing protein [Burkholderia gladioli]KAF1059219.1 putative HTH-type transcriptional regulator [Burkholderia gladioli]MBU9642904.1 winged helix-turn-helix domain-containing protein [Burkholderia gladioli]NRF83210.1 winged helix-turn-helix domain-containing protein [Burkholderia gladioli]POS03409.1 transcriptional regulator [Burkholderia gladioli]WAG23336.1 transcriptional regulator [Burkholderia gladioli]
MSKSVSPRAPIRRRVPAPADTPGGRTIAFSRFWLLRDAGLLIADGEIVAIGARPLAILILLIDANGRAVPVATLRDAVWPGLEVDTNTVQSQISALRRALGDDRDLIETVPGRGYRFAGDLRVVERPDIDGGERLTRDAAPPDELMALPEADAEAAAPRARDTLTHAQPHDPTPFVGRHAELAELLATVPAVRAVTLTGAAGIGKTRLAIEAARGLAPSFPDGVAYVPLATLSAPDRVVHAIADALDVDTRGGELDAAQLAETLRERRLLIVLDHASPVRHAVARVIEHLTAATQGVHVLATGDTPLAVGGERAIAVAPLGVSADTHQPYDSGNSDALALFFAAFARRQRRDGTPPAARLPADALAAAASICASLDGMPHPVELMAADLAAALASNGDVRSVFVACATDLDRFLAQRSGSRRRLLPHADLQFACLDFVHGRLDPGTRTTLRRLGLFHGAFEEGAAIELLIAFDRALGLDDTPAEAARRRLRQLVSAGLVDDVECDGELRLQLPPSVRRFALATLARTPERATPGALHAALIARIVARRFGAGPFLAPPSVRHDLADLRAALEWAIDTGKPELGADLLDHSAPLWVRLALGDEYVGWARRVAICGNDGEVRRIRPEMRVAAALANALTCKRNAAGEAALQWQRAYEIASACADNSTRLRALLHLFFRAQIRGETDRAREFARKYAEIADAAHWPAAQHNARLIEGLLRAYTGDLHMAIPLLSGMPDGPNVALPDVIREARALATRHGLSLHLIAGAALSTVQWLVGGTPRECEIPELNATDNEPLSCCVALRHACALAVVDDDAPRAEAYAAALVELASSTAPRRWLRTGLDVQRWLLSRQGDASAALSLVEEIARRFESHRVPPVELAFVTTLLPAIPVATTPALADTLAQGIAQAVRRADRTGERWTMPWLLHLQGVLSRARGEAHEVTRRGFLQALRCATEQGAYRIVERIRADLDALDGTAGG